MSTTSRTFRKSSFSDANGGVCVEIAGTLDTIRDSKNPETLLAASIPMLLAAIKSGCWDDRLW